MKLTVSQARRMVEACPKGSHYYLEALRTLREAGLEPGSALVASGSAPRLGLDAGRRDYGLVDDDDCGPGL